MLLFTTMPARATIPVPVMMIEKACCITSIPIRTPTVDNTTASNTMNELKKLLNCASRIMNIKAKAAMKAFDKNAWLSASSS